jgi:F-type H+-transporting ATPase subunit delta
MSHFARSYAQAFLEAAPSGYDVDGFLERADTIARVISSDGRVKRFFASPSIPAEPKVKALEALGRRVGLDQFGDRFFGLLLKRRRLADLPPILSMIRRDWDRQRGVVEALVTLASPVNPAEEASLSQALSRTVGQPVRLRTAIDDSILGGFVARVGSQLFDASVRSAIQRFRQLTSQTARS